MKNIEGKRIILLKLLEESENRFREYEKYSKGGFKNRIKKLFRYRWKYLRYALSELIKKPLLVKGKVFWGEDFYGYLPDVRYIALFGILDVSEIKLTKFFIKSLKYNSVFFDIGASYGFYSLLATQLITKGEIHSFEPTPSTFELLSKNLLNKNRVFLNQIALFNQEGEMDFYENKVGKSGLNTFNLSNIKSVFNPSLFKQIRVKASTLDKYCLSHPKPTFVKIDVEGTEGNVIEGAVKTLESGNPVIAMEVWRKPLNNEGHLKAIEILGKLGYRPHSIDSNGELIKLREIDPEKDITALSDNFVFIKL